MENVTTLQTLNGDIAKAKEVKKLATLTIGNGMNDVISFLIEEGKNDASLTMLSSKQRNKAICKAYLASDSVMTNEVKRAIKVAYAIFDGYKMKKELLSIATMEKLISLPMSEVNNLMTSIDYITEVKTLIKKYSIEKTVKVFSKKAGSK